MLKTQLDGLIVPEQGSVLQAGHLLEDLPLMWDKAQLGERHTILRGFLECVYVDLAEPPTLVGIKPKPQFLEFLDRAGSEEKDPGNSENEDSDAENASEPILTGWWRRGRLHIPQLQTSPVIIPHPVPRSWSAYTVAWAA